MGVVVSLGTASGKPGQTDSPGASTPALAPVPSGHRARARTLSARDGRGRMAGLGWSSGGPSLGYSSVASTGGSPCRRRVQRGAGAGAAWRASRSCQLKRQCARWARVSRRARPASGSVSPAGEAATGSISTCYIRIRRIQPRRVWQRGPSLSSSACLAAGSGGASGGGSAGGQRRRQRRGTGQRALPWLNEADLAGRASGLPFAQTLLAAEAGSTTVRRGHVIKAQRASGFRPTFTHGQQLASRTPQGSIGLQREVGPGNQSRASGAGPVSRRRGPRLGQAFFGAAFGRLDHHQRLGLRG
jgi:hypothetical protein